MSPEEIDTIAKYLCNEVCGDDVFDGPDDECPGQREWYRGHARAILRTVRTLGWNEPQRLAG